MKCRVTIRHKTEDDHSRETALISTVVSNRSTGVGTRTMGRTKIGMKVRTSAGTKAGTKVGMRLGTGTKTRVEVGVTAARLGLNLLREYQNRVA